MSTIHPLKFKNYSNMAPALNGLFPVIVEPSLSPANCSTKSPNFFFTYFDLKKSADLFKRSRPRQKICHENNEHISTLFDMGKFLLSTTVD